MNTVDLGSLIRLKRKEKGLNQKNLADLLHVSAAAVNKWENGKNSPDFGNLQALSVLLEIPIADLLGGFPQSPKLESDAGNVTSESDLQSSSPPKDLSSPDQSLPEQPENPAPQSEDPPEPSHSSTFSTGRCFRASALYQKTDKTKNCHSSSDVSPYGNHRGLLDSRRNEEQTPFIYGL